MLPHEHNFHRQVPTEQAPVLEVSVGLHNVSKTQKQNKQTKNILHSCFAVVLVFLFCFANLLRVREVPGLSLVAGKASASNLKYMLLVSLPQLRADGKSKVRGTILSLEQP